MVRIMYLPVISLFIRFTVILGLNRKNYVYVFLLLGLIWSSIELNRYFPVPVPSDPPGSYDPQRFPSKARVPFFYQDCNTSFLLSWDDARYTDIYLAHIDEKYDITHTIFTPSYRSYPNRSFWRFSFLMDELFQGYDVQSHCGKHIHLSKQSSSEQKRYIQWGRTGIEELFGFTPLAFAYPYGDTGGSSYVKDYFKLGRTISGSCFSWDPPLWELTNVAIGNDGINDKNLETIPSILQRIYRSPGYQVFKGYGHTNKIGYDYGVTDFEKYEKIISIVSGWPDVWYSSYGQLTAYEVEKSYIQLSEIEYYENKLEFDVSWSGLNTEIYNQPITLGVVIPKFWDEAVPQINTKRSSDFSVRNYSDCKELLMNIRPNSEKQRIIIWKDVPYRDITPPVIENFHIYTKMITQDWDQDPKQYFYTFMRFDVVDTDSNVIKVNSSVYLKNGKNFHFSKMKNPVFWNNNTYGRVVWDSSQWNEDIRQITVNEINYIVITAIDGFNNVLKAKIYPNGKIDYEVAIPSNGKIVNLPDKPSKLDTSLLLKS